MVIRCERCSTLYELDESLLAPGGSPVQCTRCQHVFTAFPPRPAEPPAAAAPPERAAGEPRHPEGRGDHDEGDRDEYTGRVAWRGAAPDHANSDEEPDAAAAPPPRGEPTPRRGTRSGAPSVYRPAASAPVGRTAAFARDSVSTVEARLRSTARLKWLVPAAVLALILLVAGAWFLFSGRGDSEVQRARAEALALIALDDTASLERASARLTEALRGAPALPAPASADRALALVLRASFLSAESEPPSDGVEAARDGDEDPAAGEAKAREEQARALARNAFEAIRAVQADAGDTPEVARALAILHAARREGERAAAVLRAARQRGMKDRWLDLAEAWLEASDPDRTARERAAGKLLELARSHPELLRGRYLLARTQASLGGRNDAIATLDALLAANPRHEAARRLRDVLAAQPLAPAQAATTAPAERAAPSAPADDEASVARARRRTPAVAVPEGDSAGQPAPAAQEGPAVQLQQPAPARRATPPLQDPAVAAPAPVKVVTQPRKRIPQPGEAAGAPTPQAVPDVASPAPGPAPDDVATPAPSGAAQAPAQEPASPVQAAEPAPPAPRPASSGSARRSAPTIEPPLPAEAGSGG